MELLFWQGDLEASVLLTTDFYMILITNLKDDWHVQHFFVLFGVILMNPAALMISNDTRNTDKVIEDQ